MPDSAGPREDCYLACFPARPIRLSRERATTMGRADGNTIVLADSNVSRRHALVEWDGETFVVRDLGSRNGVIVNDERLGDGEGRPLDSDDRIRIGERVFTFIQGEEGTVRRLFLEHRRRRQAGRTDFFEVGTMGRPNVGFSGSLEDFGLAELLQALEIGRKTGRISISSGGPGGEILLKDGSVASASRGDTAGEEAVFEMLALGSGRFVFEPRPVEADGALMNTASILMEAYRRMDEEQRAEFAAAGEPDRDGVPPGAESTSAAPASDGADPSDDTRAGE